MTSKKRKTVQLNILVDSELRDRLNRDAKQSGHSLNVEVAKLLSKSGMIILNLPKPPSVNKTRRINWAERPRVQRWIRHADAITMQAWAGGKRPMLIPGQFEAKIILPDDSAGADLDNVPKQIIDYAKRLGLIVDDSPKYMRRVIIEFGAVSSGCRLILTPL